MSRSGHEKGEPTIWGYILIAAVVLVLAEILY